MMSSSTTSRAAVAMSRPQGNLELVYPPERATRARAAARRRLQAIDECLNDLEERHLSGGYIGRRRACQRLVESLVRAVGMEAPEAVTSARTSFALHAALLDWQSSVLDQLIPNRHERFPDLDLERDDWTVPRVRRPRRSLRPQLRQQGAHGGLAGAA